MTTSELKFPEGFTKERALSLIPVNATNLLEKPRWPDELMTAEEAQFIIELYKLGSQRWLALKVVQDTNQIYGYYLIDAAYRARGEAGAPWKPNFVNVGTDENERYIITFEKPEVYEPNSGLNVTVEDLELVKQVREWTDDDEDKFRIANR